MSDKIINKLQDLINSGHKPTNIKEGVIGFLCQYFENKVLLNKYATSSEILTICDFVIRYHQDEEFSIGLKEVLECYRSAYSTNPEETLNIIVSTLKDFSQKENLMWTVKQNVPNEKNSDFYDLIISYMKHIGDNLEIGTKHIVYEIYALMRLVNKKNVNYEQIQKLDFGMAVSNILDLNKFENLLKTRPISLKLSDWRNISYHHSYEIESKKIICSYGKEKKKFEITLDEFRSYVHQIVRASNIFNIARCIFVFDNLDSIHSLNQHTMQSIEFRKPMLINQFRISLLSQGFLLMQYNEAENELIVIMNDLTNDGSLHKKDELQRKIHSSQFLYNAWCICPKETLTVIYSNKSGKSIFKSTVAGEICEAISEDKKDISYLAHNVKFEELK